MQWCKKCWSSKYVKNGYANWMQRYKCKECKCNFSNTEISWASTTTKLKALQLYLEWMWFRAIGRFLWYSNVAILNRIRWFWALAENYHNTKGKQWEILVMELDELRHFVKKNQTKLESGLLMIEKEKWLLILK